MAFEQLSRCGEAAFQLEPRNHLTLIDREQGMASGEFTEEVAAGCLPVQYDRTVGHFCAQCLPSPSLTFVEPQRNVVLFALFDRFPFRIAENDVELWLGAQLEPEAKRGAAHISCCEIASVADAWIDQNAPATNAFPLDCIARICTGACNPEYDRSNQQKYELHNALQFNSIQISSFSAEGT